MSDLQDLMRQAHEAAEAKKTETEKQQREEAERERQDLICRLSDAYVDELMPRVEDLVREALIIAMGVCSPTIEIIPKPTCVIDNIEIRAWAKALQRLGFEGLRAESKAYIVGGDDGYETHLVMNIPRPEGK